MQKTLRNNKIKEKYASGFSMEEIARIHKISRQRVSVIVSYEQSTYDKNCLFCSKEFSASNKRRTLCNKCTKRNISGRDYVRILVRKRDNFTCQDCGRQAKKTEKQLDVHHLNGVCGKKSRGYDKKDDISGLITLCHKCHFNRHDHTLKSRK